MKLLKVQTNGFNRICVVCKDDATESSYINSSKTLVVEVPFDIAEYEKYREDELPEYFISLLEAGVKKCSRDRHVPADIFQEAIQSFRKDRYQNKWTHKVKMFHSAGIKCKLDCELDLFCFSLTLEVERGDMCIFSQEILKTIPDEVVYAHRFKGIKLDGQILTVYDKFDKTVWEMSVV
ncbi:hypothetical protein [Duganella levis]|uniref:Uncharacterized protein n=1 Tax=Duganella levis TaxID=2692169 RepID=A0ABW9W9N8_9BURK|nr:hypothetical protein [Duganella levis]MYN30284.1 hypothetical protein [Duganella levis]